MKDVLAGLLVGAVGGLMGMVLMGWLTAHGGKWFAWMRSPSVTVTTTVIRIDPDHFPNFFRTGK